MAAILACHKKSNKESWVVSTYTTSLLNTGHMYFGLLCKQLEVFSKKEESKMLFSKRDKLIMHTMIKVQSKARTTQN